MQRRVYVRPRFLVFIIVVMLLCFTCSFAVAQVRYRQASSRIDALNVERALLTDEVELLSDRLQYMCTDAYVERVARDELNMLMPGEVRYVSN